MGVGVSSSGMCFLGAENRRWLLMPLFIAATGAWPSPPGERATLTLSLPRPVAFEVNVARLKPESEGALDYVESFLKAHGATFGVRIEVHTDALGDERANQQLSEERAQAVASKLVSRGISCDRLVAVGFGGRFPMASNKTPEGRAQNRRTVFVALPSPAELRETAVGGKVMDVCLKETSWRFGQITRHGW